MNEPTSVWLWWPSLWPATAARATGRPSAVRPTSLTAPQSGRWASAGSGNALGRPSHQAQLREAYHRVLGHVIPDTAEFIAGMDAADVGHMERKFAEDNRRFARESVRGSPEERVQRRVKRFAGHLESWVGRLTPEQRELLANRYSQMPDLTDELMGERRFRQSEILGLARSKPRRLRTPKR